MSASARDACKNLKSNPSVRELSYENEFSGLLRTFGNKQIDGCFVIKAWEIENEARNCEFDNCVKQNMNKDVEGSKQWVFHGTSEDNFNSIITDGFRTKLSQSARTATYFSKYLRYAGHYYNGIPSNQRSGDGWHYDIFLKKYVPSSFDNKDPLKTSPLPTPFGRVTDYVGVMWAFACEAFVKKNLKQSNEVFLTTKDCDSVPRFLMLFTLNENTQMSV